MGLHQLFVSIDFFHPAQWNKMTLFVVAQITIDAILFTEIANVADNLDSLESALDLIEERADRIREQLLELLTSNREIRQSIREENDKLQAYESSDEPGTDDKDTTTTPENNEPKPQ